MTYCVAVSFLIKLHFVLKKVGSYCKNPKNWETKLKKEMMDKSQKKTFKVIFENV